MKVLKFGGTSLGNAERIRKLYKIAVAQRQNNEGLVVVSAIVGIKSDETIDEYNERLTLLL